jgi:hypothetical protein
MHVVAAPNNLDVTTTMRSADTELQSAIELRATISDIVIPKVDLNAKAEKTYFFKHLLRNF